MIALAVALALQSTTAFVDGQFDPIAELIAQNAPQAREASAPAPTGCRGQYEQGALIICRFEPGTRLDLGESVAVADAQGFAVLGIPRNAPEEMLFEMSTVNVVNSTNQIDETQILFITQREYNLQHVDGVPQATVTPDPSTLPRRQREYAQKQGAFNSVWDGQGFLDGFISPAEGITTGVYGSARVYNNGHEGSPHWGLDWANEVGTPVYAPAGGLVTLAEPDMYYEGGLIFIDHGQGLVSAFLHLSGVEVSEGDIVEQGQLIGAMGAGGRATGSHLDWRVKLRNQFYVDPQSLLDLDLSELR
ncbi:M23 family metallopeptidase [Maricaulis sp. W15]|uniref:M23 family metallopeptidase n=1 Tax=Maricaulis sp. W15 TaxID=1772333 RepID=UPI0009F9F5F9|nr:M23 family metallopeptidase [Maricaulis sp. W15]